MCTVASLDSKCPICLDTFSNISHLEPCFHNFCFRCIKEWSKNKAECPLCKQPFSAIYYSIKSEQDFKMYDLHLRKTRSVAHDGRVTGDAAEDGGGGGGVGGVNVINLWGQMCGQGLLLMFFYCCLFLVILGILFFCLSRFRTFF